MIWFGLKLHTRRHALDPWSYLIRLLKTVRLASAAIPLILCLWLLSIMCVWVCCRCEAFNPTKNKKNVSFLHKRKKPISLLHKKIHNPPKRKDLLCTNTLLFDSRNYFKVMHTKGNFSLRFNNWKCVLLSFFCSASATYHSPSCTMKLHTAIFTT